MRAKPLNLIVACAENRVMGRGGRLPWHIPEDLAWLHERTAGQVCVLGRICFETWPRARLDGRQPVVITSRPLAGARSYSGHERDGAEGTPRPAGRAVTPLTAADVPAALTLAQELPGEIMICGGQRIFEETLPLAHRLYLTLVHAEVPGDTFFPEWRQPPWREVSRRESRDAHYRYTFLTLDRDL